MLKFYVFQCLMHLSSDEIQQIDPQSGKIPLAK